MNVKHEWLLSPQDVMGTTGQAGRFVITQRLGRGSYGEVYRAEDTFVDRPVALKALLLGESEAERLQVRHEAKVLSRIRHPNVVTVFDVLLEPETSEGDRLPPMLVMSYIEGIEFKEILRQRTSGLDPSEALKLLRPVAAALVAAHRAGVLHRDLKPSNIMVDNDDVVQLIDFGIAHHTRRYSQTQLPVLDLKASKALSSSDSAALPQAPLGLSEPGALSSRPTGNTRVGTPYYMAPELFQGAEADERTDMYAFGMVLFEALALERPVKATTWEELSERLSSGEPLPKLRDIRPDVPPAIAAVTDRALALDPAERIQRFDDLLQELDQIARFGARRLPDKPYLGLQAFTANEQGVFFGREEEIARILGRLRQERVICLVGESGAGKSSLALAGVGPAVEAGDLGDGLTWMVQRITPGREPMQALAEAMALVIDAQHDPLEDQLRESPGQVMARIGLSKSRRRRRTSAHRGLLLVVDQLEELVTVCEDKATRAAFGEVIGAAVQAEAPLRILLTVRADFKARLALIPGLAAGLEAEHLVRPLDGEALRAAVVSPLRAFGFAYENERMVDRIVAEVAGRAGSLPLLQFALLKLWDERDRKRKIITSAALKLIGGVGPAMVQAAEDVFASLDDMGLAVQTENIILDLLTPDGTKRARRLEDLVDNAFGERSQLEKAVSVLRKARLVVGGDEGLELAHEALATRWDRIRRLVERTRAEREIAAEAHHAATRWDQRERPTEMLWRGADVTAGANLLDQQDASCVHLSGLATQFVRASLKAHRRSRRRKLVPLIVALVVVPVLLASALFMFRLSQEVERAQAASASAWSNQEAAFEARTEARHLAVKERKSARTAAEKAVAAKVSAETAFVIAFDTASNYGELRYTILDVLEKRRPDRKALLALAKLVTDNMTDYQGILNRLSVDVGGRGFGIGKYRSRAPRVFMSRASVSGGLDAATIRRDIKRQIKPVYHCYRSIGLLSNPRLAGRVKVSLTIKSNGLVGTVIIASSTLNHGPTEACIKEVVSRWRFPRPEGSMPFVTYPFTFTPPSRGSGSSFALPPPGSKPRVDLDRGQINDGLGRAAVGRIVARARVCYMGFGKPRSTRLAGVLTLRVTVGAAGGTPRVVRLASTLGHALTQKCVMKVIGMQRYPKPPGGKALSLKYKLYFRPGRR